MRTGGRGRTALAGHRPQTPDGHGPAATPASCAVVKSTTIFTSPLATGTQTWYAGTPARSREPRKSLGFGRRTAPARGARDEDNPYGFVGRDGAVLALERALRRPPAGVLIQGLGGVGKTTLARGFLHWLRATHWLGEGVFWFSFQDIRNAEYVINAMVEPLLGSDARAAPMAAKVEALAGVLEKRPFLIVWYNFEVVRGAGSGLTEVAMRPEDRAHLLDFLKRLRGGRTKVIITSRDEEDWLGPTNRYKLALGGLEGEERWEFCEVILRDRRPRARPDGRRRPQHGRTAREGRCTEGRRSPLGRPQAHR